MIPFHISSQENKCERVIGLFTSAFMINVPPFSIVISTPGSNTKSQPVKVSVSKLPTVNEDPT
ncbi:MAG: hypothetical protein IPG39_11055 [Bacteroidetes bacterium]|nr:hypothetical protein [Bacteroidota bacterium]